MKSINKLWIIIPITAVLVGAIMVVCGMFSVNFDFTKFETVEFKDEIYEASGDFSKVSVNSETSDVEFVISEDGKNKVEFFVPEKYSREITVKDGTLSINSQYEGKWYYGIIGVCLKTPKITVMLASDEYESLEVNSKTGNITLPQDRDFGNIILMSQTGKIHVLSKDFETLFASTNTGEIYLQSSCAKQINLEVKTGDIILSEVNIEEGIDASVTTGEISFSNVTCNTLGVKSTTGSITLNNTVSSSNFFVQSSTGSIGLNMCDGESMSIKTSTGDVSGVLLTEKIFFAESSTGDVDVPQSMNGGKCEITTSTGNIKVGIK